MKGILKKALNQDKPNLDKQLLESDVKLHLERAIRNYIDSDYVKKSNYPDDIIIDLIKASKKIGLSQDFANELKSLIF